MHVAYRIAGFKEAERQGDLILPEHALETIPAVPDHVELVSKD